MVGAAAKALARDTSRDTRRNQPRRAIFPDGLGTWTKLVEVAGIIPINSLTPCFSTQNYPRRCGKNDTLNDTGGE